MQIKDYEQKVYQGAHLDKAELLELAKENSKELAAAANRIRHHFCQNHFDLCTIINGKSGRCHENCAFCAQSIHHATKSECYELITETEVIENAQYCDQQGIHRFSIVTSGRALSNIDLKKVCEYNVKMKEETNLRLCASHGLLDKESLILLKNSGVTRYHNNLETSRRFFPTICTTHTYEDKLRTLQYALEVGLDVCSGGIFGLGETMEDRIDLALTLRSLQVTSVPINILNPIEGTPLMNIKQISEEEIVRSVALFRFILPDAALRLAGGRGLLKDLGKELLQSGANACITGDMLTTRGISVDQDKAMLQDLEFLI